MTIIEANALMDVDRMSAAAPAATSDQSRSAPLPAFPLVSVLLLVVMGVLFAAEGAFVVDDAGGFLGPGVRTLLAFGGLQYGLTVGDGQWYRLLSAPLLHLDIMHILLNGVALFLAGRLLEPMIGRLWFAAMFVIGGIGGGAMSLAVNAHNIVSVGASGAIMALFAALYVFSFRLGEADRKTVQHRALGILIPSLLPLAHGLNGPAVDYGAHFGGVIAGAIASAALLMVWRKGSALPPLRNAAIAIVAAALLAAGYAAYANAGQYHVFALARFLAPDAEMPQGMDAIVKQSPALVEKYPHDPRARMLRAIGLVRGHDLRGAEEQVRIALSENDILRTMLEPSYTVRLESYLALILSDEGRDAEAKETARSGCNDPAADLHENLVKAGLCRTKK